jgi:hypothetical protein
MRKIVAAAIAAALLVGGALTATVIVGAMASAQEAEVDTDDLGTARRWHPGAILDEVLDELVAGGTLSRDQADAVRDGLAAKVGELRELPRVPRHPFRLGFRLGALLDDGVITADELVDLPDGHPLADPDGPAMGYLDDGEITADEMRSLLRELRAERRDG